MRRYALTPRQKSLKDEYLLERDVQSKGVPRWSDVWAIVRETSDFKYILHTEVGRNLMPAMLRDGPELEAYMQRLDPDAWSEIIAAREAKDSELAGVLYDELEGDAHLEYWDARDETTARRKEDAAAELEPLLEAEYRKLVKLYQRYDGDDIWRAVAVPRGVEIDAMDRLGVYWSLEQAKAGIYHAAKMPRGGEWNAVVFRGVLDVAYLDWAQTLAARFDTVYGHREAEARLLPRAPIFVHDAVKYTPRDWRWGRKEGYAFDIGDWRRA